jgi:hypothetical protein
LTSEPCETNDPDGRAPSSGRDVETLDRGRPVERPRDTQPGDRSLVREAEELLELELDRVVVPAQDIAARRASRFFSASQLLSVLVLERLPAELAV